MTARNNENCSLCHLWFRLAISALAACGDEVRNASWTFLLLAAFVLNGCASFPHGATNLADYKQVLRHYVDSGEYNRDLETATAPASVWIEQRAAHRQPNEKLAIAFDLDDTLLSGWPYLLEYDFGYNKTAWQTWVDAANAPALAPVRELYRKARQLGIDVIYLTARPEHDREATLRNLRAIDCADYAMLICKPDGLKSTAALFKAAERKRLAEEGHVLIAMIGDQESDLAGGFAERMFKLPNPFYRVP